jgi:hypothetical protein
VLVRTARGAADPQTAAFCFQALELLTIWPIVVAALGSLVTGCFSAWAPLMFPPIMAASAPGLRHSAASVRAVGTDQPDHGNGQAHGE